MESMPIKINPSLDYCLSYWTQLLGTDTSIEVFIVKYGQKIDPKNQLQSLSITNGTKSVWTKVDININKGLLINASDFSVTIKGYFYNPKSFIALDDIKLDNNECESTVGNYFYCTDGTQLNVSQVCNFVKDCPHSNDDELNCGECDFEKGIKYLSIFKKL